MDRYNTMQYVRLSDMTFRPHQYVEYSGGHVKSQGLTNLSISISSDASGEIKVALLGNDITKKISSSFIFDKCLTLDDRLLMFISPKKTNTDILVLNTLNAIGIPHTRFLKLFSSIEPVVGSIFTENGRIVKISFTISGPERLIEFE